MDREQFMVNNENNYMKIAKYKPNDIENITINKNINNYNNNKVEKNKIFLGFKGPISCIIQTRMTGNIIVSCWDGNNYLFTPPNFDIFTKDQDEKAIFINSLIVEKNDNVQNNLEDEDEDDNVSGYAYCSYFKDNNIESPSYHRKLTYEISNSNFDYSKLQLIDNYFFEEIIFDIKQIIKKSSIKIYSTKENEKIICKYDDINYGDNCSIKYHILQKSKKTQNKLQYEEFIINQVFIKFMKSLDFIIDTIQSKYNNKFKLEIKLEFQNQKKDENNNDDYNIRCIYYFFVPTNKECIIIFQDNNILSTNNKFQGLEYLLKEINNKIYNNLEFEENHQNKNIDNPSDSITSFSKKDNSNIISFRDDIVSEIISNSFSNSSDNNNINRIIKKIPTKLSEKNVIDYSKIVGRHQNGANSINILSNDIIISFGINNEICIYKFYNKIMELKIGNLEMNYEKTIFERTNKDIDIVIFHKNKLIFVSINLENKTSYFNIFEHHEISFSFYLDVCSKWKENSLYKKYRIDILFNNIQKQLLEYIKKSNNDSLSQYQKGIIINKNLLVYIYNGGVSDDNKLLFYNQTLKKNVSIIRKYSFSKHPNGLYLISKEDNKKILFCACQKYFKKQNNGIMMVKINLESKKKPLNYYFYKTNEFRVYCFCPLLNINNNYIEENEEQYFFVGGYNKNKKQGIIKLYKINYNKKNFKKSIIEPIKNITLEDNYFNRDKKDSLKRFNSPITCITQDKVNGYILITCDNGNVYQFLPPNLDSFKKN